MELKEAEALQNLVNINEQQDNWNFQPFKSILFYRQTKRLNNQKRPQTVTYNRRKNNSIGIQNQQNQRQKLKKQLRILEDNSQETGEKKHFEKKKFITTQSVLCMLPNSFASNYMGFPSQSIKKQNPQKNYINIAKSKQNCEGPIRLKNTEQMIRMDIKRRIEIREQYRRHQKLIKINNFLQQASNSKRITNTSILLKRLQQKKLKKTLTNLLS